MPGQLARRLCLPSQSRPLQTHDLSALGPNCLQPPAARLLQPGLHMALAAAPCSALAQQPASISSRRAAHSASGVAAAGSRRGAALRVQAVAAPAATMKTFQAPLSAEQLKEFTSRPRIDFSKILDTVRVVARVRLGASDAEVAAASAAAPGQHG